MAHPFFDAVAYPIERADAKELYDLLVQAVTTRDNIDLLYRRVASGLRPLPETDPDLIWKRALDNLASAGALRAFLNVLEADSDFQSARFGNAIENVRNAVFAFELRFVPESVAVLDRVELRNNLTNLQSDDSNLRVLLVRGGPKTGKSWGVHLFERAAKERGAASVYLFDGYVATVDEVLRQLFGALGAPDEITEQGATTKDAWHRMVCFDLRDVAMAKSQPLWIAIDDLGPGPGDPPTPLLDKEIREFCDQLALCMADPAFGKWFRLMLIHYPEGDVPTKWREGVWKEDRTSDTDVKQEDVEEYLRSWAAHQKRQLLDDQVRTVAAGVVSKAAAPPPAGGQALPRLRQLYDALQETLEDLGKSPP